MPYPITLFDEKTLFFTPDKIIKEGKNRNLYIHPDNPDLCLKIERDDTDVSENRIDILGYTHEGLLGKPQSQEEAIWQHLPRMHGWQATNMGDGLVFDYYHKADGSPSPTLEAVIKEIGYTDELKSAVDRLLIYIKQNQTWVRDPALRNIVLADDGYLKLIDSIGTKAIMWKKHIPFIRKYRTRKKITIIKRRIDMLLTSCGE